MSNFKEKQANVQSAPRISQEHLLAMAKRQHRLDQLALLRTFNAEVNNRQVRRHYARIMEKRK